LLATQVLPVGVLDPHADQLFIAHVTDLFEQLQADHQSNGMPWAANAAGVESSEFGFAGLPIYPLGKLHEGVTVVDDVDQFQSKQVNFLGVFAVFECHFFATFRAFNASIVAISLPQ
jgi:hypothetical protein